VERHARPRDARNRICPAAAIPRTRPIVLCAFCVVLGTLVIQGLTLRPLLLLLRREDDGAVEREVSRARVAVMQAAVDSLDGDTSPAASTIREQYAAARKVAEDQHEPQAATKYDELRLRAIIAQCARRCWACPTKARSATTHSTASRRSPTGPNSMPPRPEPFSRWRRNERARAKSQAARIAQSP